MNKAINMTKRALKGLKYSRYSTTNNSLKFIKIKCKVSKQGFYVTRYVTHHTRTENKTHAKNRQLLMLLQYLHWTSR